MVSECLGSVYENGSYRQCRRLVVQNGGYCPSHKPSVHVPKPISQQGNVVNNRVEIQTNVVQECDRVTATMSNKYQNESAKLWQKSYELDAIHNMLKVDLIDLDHRYIVKYTGLANEIVRHQLTQVQYYNRDRFMKPLYNVIYEVKTLLEVRTSQQKSILNIDIPPLVEDPIQACVQYGQYILLLQKQRAKLHGLWKMLLAAFERILTIATNVLHILTSRTQTLIKVVSICVHQTIGSDKYDNLLENDLEYEESVTAETLVSSLQQWLSADALEVVDNMLKPRVDDNGSSSNSRRSSSESESTTYL